jgi:hypothetical protein
MRSLILSLTLGAATLFGLLAVSPSQAEAQFWRRARPYYSTYYSPGYSYYWYTNPSYYYWSSPGYYGSYSGYYPAYQSYYWPGYSTYYSPGGYYGHFWAY